MRLPNAPLLEVVFELRWHIQKNAPNEPFGYDPGFHRLADNFQNAVTALGYNSHEPVGMAQTPLAHTPVHRFRISGEQQFPLLQIGHGLFACNLATDYDWEKFRDLLDVGLKALLDSHPRDLTAPLSPILLELRYVDAFDKELLGHTSLGRFLTESTSFEIGGIPYLSSEVFEGDDRDTNFKTRKNLTGDPNSYFQLEASSGKISGDPGIIMTSRVVKNGPEIELGTNSRSIKKNILDWADKAHGITSPFFRSFINQDLMEVFSSQNN